MESDSNKQIDETALVCARCAVKLESIETKFSYLGHTFSHAVPKCPVCGQIYLSEKLTQGKIAEVEAMLEDK